MDAIRKISSFFLDRDSENISAPFICKWVLIALVIGVVARLALGFFFTHLYDMHYWGLVIQNINSGNGLYEITGFFYTPVWGYILGAGAFFQDILGVGLVGARVTELLPIEDVVWYYSATFTTPAFNMAIKFMFLLSDIVVGYLIFWLIRDYTGNHKKAVLGFMLWFLCPPVIAAGSMLGMFDTITVMITLLSIIMLKKERYIESGILLSIAVLLKFFPAFFVPMFLAYIIARHRGDGTALKKVAYFIIAAGVTALVIFLPQILDGTLAECFLFITLRVDNGVGSSAIMQIGGYIAIAVFASVLLIYTLYAAKISKIQDVNELNRKMFDAFLIIIATLFLYPPLPQYVLLLLPFLIFATIVSDKRYIIPLVFLMIGTTMAAFNGGPINLSAVANFTDVLDLNSLIGVINGYIEPVFGTPLPVVVGLLGSTIQYIGILLVLWVRFGYKVKNIIFKNRDKTDAS